MADSESSQDDLKALTPLELTKRYNLLRLRFRTQQKRAVQISKGAAGLISQSAREYWASVLFTRFAVTAGSANCLLPNTEPRAHWDFSAFASIVRNLGECYLLFYWLCVDPVEDVQAKARFVLLDLYDHGARRRLFANPQESDVVQADLVRRFEENVILAALPEKRKRELLRGEKLPFVQDEVVDAMGDDRAQFRFFYRFLSQHTHSGPIAFYRMGEHGRGRGIENRTDKIYFVIVLGAAIDLVESACGEMLSLFPGAEERGRRISDSTIARRVERENGRPARGRPQS